MQVLRWVLTLIHSKSKSCSIFASFTMLKSSTEPITKSQPRALSDILFGGVLVLSGWKKPCKIYLGVSWMSKVEMICLMRCVERWFNEKKMNTLLQHTLALVLCHHHSLLNHNFCRSTLWRTLKLTGGGNNHQCVTEIPVKFIYLHILLLSNSYVFIKYDSHNQNRTKNKIAPNFISEWNIITQDT